jgi:hypothetical protein
MQGILRPLRAILFACTLQICLRKRSDVANDAVQRAVDFFDGSPSKMAAALGGGVRRQHVEHWLKSGRIPTEHCAAVHVLTGVPRWELRPEDWDRIWPELTAQGPPRLERRDPTRSNPYPDLERRAPERP